MSTPSTRIVSGVLLLLLALAPAWVVAAPADVPAPKNDPTGRFMARHEAHLARAQAGPIGVLFLGDSITQGWDRQTELWETSFGAYAPANFGIGGDQTQHVLWRIQNGALDFAKPRVVVLLIGTNNTGANTATEIAEGVRAILDTVQEKAPAAKVVLLAVFPRGPRTSGNGRVNDHAPKLAKINELNPLLAAMADGDRVRFLDLGPKFLGEDGTIPAELMPDQLHLSAAGYRVWAEGLRPVLAELMAP